MTLTPFLIGAGCPMGAGKNGETATSTLGNIGNAPTGSGSGITQDSASTDTPDDTAPDKGSTGADINSPHESPITVMGNPQGGMQKPPDCSRPVDVALDHLLANISGHEAGSGRLAVHVEGDSHPSVNGQAIKISDASFPSNPPYITYADKLGHFEVAITGPAGRVVRFETEYCKIVACYELTLKDTPETMTFEQCPEEATVTPNRPLTPHLPPKGDELHDLLQNRI